MDPTNFTINIKPEQIPQESPIGFVKLEPPCKADLHDEVCDVYIKLESGFRAEDTKDETLFNNNYVTGCASLPEAPNEWKLELTDELVVNPEKIVIKGEPELEPDLMDEIHVKDEIVGDDGGEVQVQFKCNDCNYPTGPNYDGKDRPYVCDVCGHATTRKSLLKDHQMLHTGEKPYSCNMCGYKATRSSTFREHLIMHSGEKAFACGECDYRGAKKRHLDQHLKIHTGHKPFVCNICNYQAVLKGQLRRHLACHTGEKPYRCNDCEFRTGDKSSLRRHMKIHRGEKSYACVECEYRTSQRCSLQRHVKSHTGEKPYACGKCGYRTADRGHLMRHIRKISHIQTGSASNE